MARVKKNTTKSQTNIAILFVALDRLDKGKTYADLAASFTEIFEKFKATTEPSTNGLTVFFKYTDTNPEFIINAVECGLELTTSFKKNSNYSKRQLRLGLYAGFLNSIAKTRVKKSSLQLAEFISFAEAIEKSGRWFELNTSDSIRDSIDVSYDLIKIKSIDIDPIGSTPIYYVQKAEILEPEPFLNYLKFKISGREDILNSIDKLLQPPYPKEQRIDRYLPILIGLAGDSGMGRLRMVDAILDRFFSFYRVPAGIAHHSLPGCNSLIVSLLCSVLRVEITNSESDVKNAIENRFRELEKVYSNHKVQRWLKDHERVYTDEIKKLRDSKAIIGNLLGLRYSDNRLQYLDAKSLITEGHLALRYLLHAVSFELWLDSEQATLFALVFDNIHLAHSIDKSYIENLCNVFLSPMPLVLIFTSNTEFEFPENWLAPTSSKVFVLDKLNQHKLKEYACNILNESKPDKSVLDLLVPNPPATYLSIEERFFDMLMSGRIKPKKAQSFDRKARKTWGFSFKYNHPDLREKLEHSPYEAIVHPEFREIILNRFYLLPENLGLVLQVATVQGYQFVYHNLNQIFNSYQKDEEKSINLDVSLKELQRYGWLKPCSNCAARNQDQQVFVFRNPVLQEVLYNEMDQRRKKKIHRVTAEYLESIMHRPYGHFIGVILFHWESAKVWHNALDYGLKYAQYLIDAGHINNALELYKHIEQNYLPEMDWNKWLELHPEDGEPDALIDLSPEETTELDRIVRELIKELDIKDDKEITAELGLDDIDLGLLPTKHS